MQEGGFPNDDKTQKYGNLLFLLQSEPRHIAHLCRLVSMAEIDSLLQTVMFTIYGNQYESREEHLLLTMFQVRRAWWLNVISVRLRKGLTSCPVGLDIPVRQYTRILFPSPCQYPSVADDDHVYQARTWAEFPQGCST